MSYIGIEERLIALKRIEKKNKTWSKELKNKAQEFEKKWELEKGEKINLKKILGEDEKEEEQFTKEAKEMLFHLENEEDKETIKRIIVEKEERIPTINEWLLDIKEKEPNE